MVLHPRSILFFLLLTLATSSLDVGIVLSGRFDHHFGFDQTAVAQSLAADGASHATALCHAPSDAELDAATTVRSSGLDVVLTQTNATIDTAIRNNYPLQFQRLDQCYLALEAWGRRNGRHFSHFLRLRPDTVWDGPMPRISSLPSDAISLRARELYANFTLADAALSWPRAQCMKERDCGDAVANAATANRSCVVPDDQWAVVPRSFGS